MIFFNFVSCVPESWVRSYAKVNDMFYKQENRKERAGKSLVAKPIAVHAVVGNHKKF